jgi:ASC-1-like (ASCH) protein
MTKKRLKMRAEWEEAIRQGRKTIDARLVADDIGELKVGDVLHYPAATARVKEMRYYPGFRDLLAHEDWRRIAPEAACHADVLKLLEAGHRETVRQSGAVAIELEPVTEQKPP